MRDPLYYDLKSIDAYLNEIDLSVEQRDKVFKLMALQRNVVMITMIVLMSVIAGVVTIGALNIIGYGG